MTERQLTFIDVDENSLVLWLKEDRVQLRVVDSRPELEAEELRAFASVLFATYVAAPLVARLEAACAELGTVREQLASAGGASQVAVLDGSLRAIGEVAAAIAGVRKAAAPPAEADPATAPPAAAAAPRRSKRSRRGKRAGESTVPGWTSPSGHIFF